MWGIVGFAEEPKESMINQLPVDEQRDQEEKEESVIEAHVIWDVRMDKLN